MMFWIIVITGTIALSALIHLFLWMVNTEGYRLSFNQFKALYNNSSEKWHLMEDIVVYKSDSVFDWEKFYFSIPDTMRYHRWLSKKEKEEQSRKYREAMSKIAQEWLKDIEKYRRENQDFADTKMSDRTDAVAQEAANGKRDTDFIHLVC